MKRYTLEDFSSFERDEEGWILCPPGDYTQIHEFPVKRCGFDFGCSFGPECRFDSRYRFNIGCKFGMGCRFGFKCRFDRECSFGKGCVFGSGCSFGFGCYFGENCYFGKNCDFGKWCHFGENCYFSSGCTIENGKPMRDMLKFEGFGCEKRMTYFFLLTDGKIYVRCGCFAGYLDEFRKKVEETHGTNRHAKDYLAIANFTELHWKRAQDDLWMSF